MSGAPHTTVTVHLDVDGMMCQRNCGTTVENALRAVPGVVDAKASFSTRSAWATLASSGPTRPADLVSAVEEVGFDAKLQTTTVHLRVEGMMCQRNCGTTVENALRAVSGVTDAKATFATRSAWATVASGSSTQAADLVEAVQDVGFDAQLKTTSKIYCRVEGMMCQRNCGTTVRNALLQVPGVVEAESSFLHGQAWAEVPQELDTPSTAREIVDAIDCVGFEATWIGEEEAMALRNERTSARPTPAAPPQPPPPAETDRNVIVLSVEGMSCAVCTGRVERALMQVPGIASAFVSLATHRAEITFSDEESSDFAAEELAIASQKAVQRTGYPCEILSAGRGASMTLQENVQILEDAKHSELRGWRNLLILAVTLVVPMMWLMRKMGQMMEEQEYHHSTTTTSSAATSSPGPMANATHMSDDAMSESMMTIHTSDYHLSTCMGRYMLAMAILSTLSQFLVGYRFYKGAWKAGRDFGMDFLVVLGTTSSYVYSVGVWVWLLVQSHTQVAPDDTVLKPTFGTGPMLLTFVVFGKFLEAYAKGKTSSALEALMKLQPQWASRIVGGLEGWQDTTLAAATDTENQKPSQLIHIAALETEEVDTCVVKLGEYVRVLPGARIPTDGVIVALSSTTSAQGQKSLSVPNDDSQAVAYIDESAFSGEPFPVPKSIGDHVYGSSVNQLTVLVIRVTATGSNSVLAKIVRLMEDAQRNKAPIQALADKIASIFAPVVMGLAVITFLFWVVLDSGADTNQERLFLAFLSAISVVVVACPCALGLATPTAVMVGTGVGATHGLLIKGGSVLEEMQSINTMVFDKTGTLTTGKAVLGQHKELVQDLKDPILQFVPSKVLSNKKQGSNNHNLALWLAACAESQSEHPLAQAVVNAAKSFWGGDVTCSQEGVTVDGFTVTPGAGVECVVAKQHWGSYLVRVGNKQWAQEPVIDSAHGSLQEIMPPEDCSGDMEVAQLRQLGQIGVYVSVLKSQVEETSPDLLGSSHAMARTARQRRVIGVLGVVDPIREQAKSSVAALKGMGVDVYLLTGDHELTAKAVARQVGIKEENVCAGVKPEEKAEYISQLQSRQGPIPDSLACRRVGFVGDGINDAIALARANVGIAIGAGTEVAVEAADIVLVRSDLHDVVVALHLSQVVFRRIRMNFIWAMAYNLLALPFAAGILYPFTDFRLPPEYAGLMMAFSSVSVVTSSLLLRNYKRPAILEDGSLKGGSGFLQRVFYSCEGRRMQRAQGYRIVKTASSDLEASPRRELELV